ncbi:MAG: IreB family regulatory phosphoprotein [Lachnospiraceae bacterium]
MTENGTTKFTPVMEGARDAGAILNHVYRALQAKGYDPVTRSSAIGSPAILTCITSHGQSRAA